MPIDTGRVGGGPIEQDDIRLAELAGNLARVRSRIADACAAAGRERAEVTLVAVTKTYPASDVVHLATLGVRDIGENRDQEAGPKAAAVAELVAARTAAADPSGYPPVRWHFIGHLQRNKCRSVAGYADLVQSVDSVRLVAALADAARGRDQPLEVLLQVSLDGDPSRGGAVDGTEFAAVPAGQHLDRVAALVGERPELRLRGVMAVAPLSVAPDGAFARLRELALQIRVNYPNADIISAGMSDDFEVAIAHGATHVRVGSALLGKRATLR